MTECENCGAPLVLDQQHACPAKRLRPGYVPGLRAPGEIVDVSYFPPPTLRLPVYRRLQLGRLTISWRRKAI